MIKRTMLVVLSAAALGAFPGSASRVDAQGASKQKNNEKIPREYRPPAGMCRVWVDGVPAAQQPAPTDCPAAVKNKPANGKVIYGEPAKGRGTPLPERAPVKSFIKAVTKKPPLIPPDQA